MDKKLADRKEWMGLLARAPAGQPPVILRSPEIGSVMVRGRAGGTGAPFNVGEMTVTRCSLKLGCGTVGHAYVQGRNKDDARSAALVDALMQTAQADTVRAAVVETLKAEEDARRHVRAAKAAATKVEFFTMVRGED